MYNPVNPSCKGGGELHRRDEKWPTYTTVRIIRCSSSLSFSFGPHFSDAQADLYHCFSPHGLSSLILPFFSMIPIMI